MIYASYSKLFKELKKKKKKKKNGIEILVGLMVFKLWTKQSKCCLDQ